SRHTARVRRRRLLPRLGAGRVHQRHDGRRRRRHVPRASVRKLFSSTTAFVAGLVLAAIVGALLILPSDDYIFLPDKAHPVAPLITVPGGHDPTHGGIYFVDIKLRK